ncbi:hypothetical protein [Endozoicomonas sp. ONNA2]|uniref:hypothetical protein n=1 Tax=Endozoicomonas sp. ONNA2 TaxID=2828741 RepID=UPI002148FFC9|nr:hypothetical protein [Endozoicomonas sp. ONNA2]
MKPAPEAIAEATDNNASIGKMSEDNGYYSGSNLQAFNAANIDAYMATDRQEKPATERLEDFTDRRERIRTSEPFVPNETSIPLKSTG